MKKKYYYKKILLTCIMFMLVFSVLQAGLFYQFSSVQFREYTSELSSKVANSIHLEIENYFNMLDDKLDNIYRYPEFLRNLNDDTLLKYEEPTRALLAQSTYFRSLMDIYVYNNSHILKSYYRRTKSIKSADIYENADAATLNIQKLVSQQSAEIMVFCFQDEDGISYLRIIKRLNQNMGKEQAGYLICDLRPMALLSIVLDSNNSSDQYIWLLDTYGNSIYLSEALNAKAIAYMTKHTEYGGQTAFEKADGSNHYLQTAISPFGFSTCIFTDETQLQNSYRMLLLTLLQSVGIVVLLSSLFSMAMSRNISHRLSKVTGTMLEIEAGKTSNRLDVDAKDEIGIMCESFNHLLNRVEIYTVEEAKSRTALDEARYQSLQAQINPHFLFNTLDNIRAIALTQNQAVVDDLCNALSKMLRYSIQTDTSHKHVTIRDEIAYVKDYLYIVSVRMHNEIQFAIDIESGVEATPIPCLSIQPLVENAIRHGLRNKRGEKRLMIRAKRNQEKVIVTVQNNGSLINLDQFQQIIQGEAIKQDSQHTSIGIHNIHERIQLLFGQTYGLSATHTDGMTCIAITVPYQSEVKLL